MVFAPLSLPDTCHDELRYGYVIRYTSWFSAGVHDGRSLSCQEKTRLTARYEAATTRFCEAVTELNQKMGTSAKAEYDHLARVANELRLNSEQARLALEQTSPFISAEPSYIPKRWSMEPWSYRIGSL